MPVHHFSPPQPGGLCFHRGQALSLTCWVALGWPLHLSEPVFSSVTWDSSGYPLGKLCRINEITHSRARPIVHTQEKVNPHLPTPAQHSRPSQLSSPLSATLTTSMVRMTGPPSNGLRWKAHTGPGWATGGTVLAFGPSLPLTCPPLPPTCHPPCQQLHSSL